MTTSLTRHGHGSIFSIPRCRNVRPISSSQRAAQHNIGEPLAAIDSTAATRRLAHLARLFRAMSTTAPDAFVLPKAPWRSLFDQHVQKMPSAQFVLGTLGNAPKGSPTPLVPRVRYCIFRGFWTELPENKHNDAERNPKVFESDCPTFTTDVRMEKVGHIFGTSAGHAESSEQTQGSGGGGPVEAVWWVEETGTQWRVKGRAYVIANDIQGDTESSGVRTVKSELGKRMRVVDETKEKDWSWARELTASFGNQSPGIKGEIASCLYLLMLAHESRFLPRTPTRPPYERAL